MYTHIYINYYFCSFTKQIVVPRVGLISNSENWKRASLTYDSWHKSSTPLRSKSFHMNTATSYESRLPTPFHAALVDFANCTLKYCSPPCASIFSPQFPLVTVACSPQHQSLRVSSG